MSSRRSAIPSDSLLQLRQRLDRLPPKSPERANQIAATAQLYGISVTTVYRALHLVLKPRTAHRSDHGQPRILPPSELEHYCELIAALKLRTTNESGRHLSTGRAIQLLEEHGVETVQGLIKSPKGLLRKQTVNRWLSRWRLDQPRLLREPPAVRFQAENSNDCWQFDMSPSDLKHIERPDWVDPARGEPTLMLFSVVDDRSGVAYQEYRCVYGEDAESALRFLFNAMAPKTRSDFPFQGRPKLLYLDNGPVAKNHVFQNVMQSLKVDWLTHTPAGKDGTRTTARSKGKVERPFRTVKEAHETLYHFHKPETELQANEWLWNYLSRYNAQRHRSEKHSRLEDWLANIGQEGVRDMCSWEQYCRFAREPESRKVGVDARITIDGTAWEVEPDMAGETVILLWGLFDEEMYVEFTGETWGPYYPVSGPVPLHRYRTFRRGKAAERADRIHALARQLNIPISALSGSDLRVVSDDTQQRIDALPHQPFDTRKFEYHFPTVIAAKLAIADDLAIPLARMSDEDRAFIDSILTETLNRSEVLARIRDYFRSRQSGEDHAG
ncbi:TPA: transposase family protein [Salmonella enterica subsp. enterica serovar Dublin]|nr:transposase family protein [Salmonella enterica subsp. enterica serovar Dublin]HCC8890779.1 transposase family protein [Salmonella enterica subsp. enterica serovar Dublin]